MIADAPQDPAAEPLPPLLARVDARRTTWRTPVAAPPAGSQQQQQ